VACTSVESLEILCERLSTSDKTHHLQLWHALRTRVIPQASNHITLYSPSAVLT
jgi:hypothetical protein